MLKLKKKKEVKMKKSAAEKTEHKIKLWKIFVFAVITLIVLPTIIIHINEIHASYVNSELITATISDIAGCGNRQIEVTYKYEIGKKEYNAKKKEEPNTQKIGNTEEIRVNSKNQKEILKYTEESDAIAPYISYPACMLLMIFLFLFVVL